MRFAIALAALMALIPILALGQSRQMNSGDVTTALTYTPQKIFNVIDFGATGNGTTNDQAAINNALTACGNAGGGQVVLGNGRYLVDTVGLSVPSRCIVYCPVPLLGNANPTNYSTAVYSIILNSSQTISMSEGSGWYGCPVLQKAMVNAVAWADYPSLTQRDTLNLVATFAGTAFTWAVADVTVRDAMIGGFALGINATSHAARTRLDHVNIDATKCMLIDGSHDISRFSHVQCSGFMTGGYANAQTSLAISNIANASGLYRVTLSSSSSIPVTGDTVWIDQTVVGPQSVQARRWTITQIDSTHFDLQGSQGTGSFTTSGTTISGSKVLTTLASTANIGVGQTITGTNIPGGTTVTWVAANGADIGISNNATGGGSGITFTFSDTAYSSGGTANWDASFRSDIGMEFTNSEGDIGSDLFTFGHVTGFHMGTGMSWFSCSGCWNDGPVNSDITATSVLVDGTSKGTTWYGGRLNNTAIRVNSSSPVSAGTFTGINMDSTASNWAPVIEMDQGLATFTGNSSTNGAGWYLFKDAITSATIVGNTLTGDIAFESSVGVAKVQSVGNAITSTDFQGIAFLKNQQVQIGGGGANCVFSPGLACSVIFGGQQVDASFGQTVMTNAGSNTVSGNSHSTWYHATGSISTYTINLPVPAQAGQEYLLLFDQVVSTLTMGGTSSTGMPTSTVANTWYKCVASSTSAWVCGTG